MTPAKTKAEIPQDGIWGRVEQPELQAEGSGCNSVRTPNSHLTASDNVLKIVAIDPTGKPQFTVWRRDGRTDVDNVAESSNLSTLERRDNMQTCYPDEELAKVDDVVDW